jgi:hypothetical protein
MVVVNNPSEGKPSMGRSIGNLAAVTRVGLDLAKKVFQVHAVDAKGEIVVARKLRFKAPPFNFGGGTKHRSSRCAAALRASS